MRKVPNIFDLRLWPKKIILLISLLLALILSSYFMQRPPPQINRQLDPSNKQVELLWTKQEYLLFQNPIWSQNTVYAYAPPDYIIAFNGVSGGIFWKRVLPFKESGVRDFLASTSAIFNVTTTDVYAYTASFGDQMWATHLGDGHVGIYSQLEDSLLRIYYGNKIFEISPASGEILKEQDSGNIYWIEDNVEIHTISPNQDIGLRGIDHTTGEIIWENINHVFSRENGFPIQSGSNSFIVLTDSYGICALDIETGRYIWCRPEEYKSNLGMEEDENVGYLLRKDFSLIKLNLASGEVLAEIQFLPKELPQEMQNTGYEYSLAVTKDAVIVSFGDSGETFALRNLP
jgi:outer membrane protein assembly factor BamB